MSCIIRVFVVLSLILTLSSCIRDDLEKLRVSNWEPEIALPLIDSRFGIDRVLSKAKESGNLFSGEDNIVTLIYSGEIFHFSGSELFPVGNFFVDIANKTGDVKVPVPGRKIEVMELDRGFLSIRIEAYYTEDTKITFSLPTVTKDGVPFARTIIIPVAVPAFLIYEDIYDISGYYMDLSGSSGNETNVINAYYKSEKVSNGDNVKLDLFRLGFTDLEYSFLGGYFGATSFGVQGDSIAINLFENFKSGTIVLEDPKFRLSFENSYGMPLRLSIGNFISTNSGRVENLNGDVVINGIEILSPLDTNKTAKSVEFIERTNSNIIDFLSISPTMINFDFNVTANAGGDSTKYNFLTNSSFISGSIDLEIPFKGRFDSVVVEDVFEFRSAELEHARKAIFKLWTENSFPVGIYFQLYFLNKNELILDSLLSDNNVIFKEAGTDSEGYSVEPKLQDSYFELDEYRFRRVRELTETMKVRAMILSDSEPVKNIKITSDNYFHFKLGVITQVER